MAGKFWRVFAGVMLVTVTGAGADPLAENEALVWQAVSSREVASDYAFYLKFYPSGPHAAEASQKSATAASASPLQEPLPVPPAGFDDANNWIGDPHAQCWGHDRDKRRDDGVALIWSGKCQGAKLEGPGVAVSLTMRGRIAKIAIGTYTKGLLHGKALVLRVNADRQEGVFADGHLNGEGGIYYSDGGRQVGTFKNGMLNGHGIQEVSETSRTEGSWENGFVDGHAVTTYTNGDRTEGDYLMGLKNGFVRTELAGGSRIEASYKRDRLDGHLVQTMKDGSRFEADYADGYMMTDATFTRPNGERITGHYVPPRPDREHTKPLDDLYPRFAAFVGEEGKLRLRVTVNEDGSFSDVIVLKSSGFKRLDDAALKLVKDRIAYFPATVAGHPITMSGWPILVWFKLNP